MTRFRGLTVVVWFMAGAGALAATITQNFETSSLGDTTPPGGWSLVVVDPDPQSGYLTTTGNGGGLGGQVTGNNDSNSNNVVGAYFVNSGDSPFGVTQAITGSFDFKINNIGNYSNVHFLFGDIQTGITETTPGEYLGVKLMKNTFGNRGGVVDGAGSGVATDTTQQLAADTWYTANFSWTPTTGRSGIFSYTANGITSTITSPFTFDSSQAWFGFGAAGYYSNDTLGVFDNISITGTPIRDLVWDGTDKDWAQMDSGNTHWLDGGSPANQPPIAVDSATINGGTVTVSDAGRNAGLVSVNKTGAAPTVLDIVSGGELTIGSELDVGADAQVTVQSGGLLTAPLVNTSGTTSIGGGAITTANVTGGATSVTGGAVTTLNADGGTVHISTPANSITTLNGNGAAITSSGAALATNVNLDAGSITVSNTTVVDKLQVSGGQINAGTNTITVGSEMKLGAFTTVTGTGFGAGGTINKDGVGRLELNGGTVALTVLGPPAVTGINYVQITGDADAGISSTDTVTHAIDWGASGTATVNGVAFANDVGIAAGGRTNSGVRTYGPNPHGGSTPPAVSGDIASVFRDMRYGGPDGGYVEITGLTPGDWYDLRMYDRAWDYEGAIRTFYYEYDIGGDGSTEFTTPKIDQNRANLTPPGMSGNVSWATSYIYQADATGKMRVSMDLADDQTGTYHLYGLTNKLVPAGDGHVDMPDTDILVNTSSTLQLDTPLDATFGNLGVAANQTLTMTGAPNYTVKNITAGTGAKIIASSGGGTPGDADLRVGGTLSPGNSPGVVDINGNLTMLASSTYDWELGDPLSDAVHVDGNLTLTSGWTLNLIDLGGSAIPTDQFDLFTYTGSLSWADPLILAPVEWNTTGLDIITSENGRVYLTGLTAGIPEPSTVTISLLALACLFRRPRRG